ncbi:MAG TPA: hypothetical protein VHB97_22305 [Polyangia bacterium]|nr:hypothetical protein [Polyangia bacterium]
MSARVIALALFVAGCSPSSSSSNDMGGGGGGVGGGDGGGAGGGGGGSGHYDWLQFGFDEQHSGNNPLETTIGAANVASLVMKQQVTFPAPVDGAPVYLEAVTTANGTQDLVFVETAAADVYALDAKTLATVWMKSHPHAGTCTSSNGGACYTTSEPAIDPNRMFVYAYGLDGLVHKHAVGDGSETTGGGWPATTSLKPNLEKGSSDLAVAVAKSGTFLYAAAAGYPGDAGDYQGHLTTIKLADGTQNVFNVLCSNMPEHFTAGGSTDCAGQTQAAVWSRGGVLYRADADRIYLATGNGPFDVSTTSFDWGDSVLALAADGSGTATGPLDSWTPSDQAALNSADADVGSTGPALIPVPAGSKYPHVALQGNKVPMGATAAPIRLIDLDNLSGAGGPGNLGGELFAMNVPQGDEILTQPAVWVNPADQSTWVFIADDSGIAALELVPDGGTGKPSLKTMWMKAAGGTSPVIANNILYYSGNGAGRNGANSVYAIDPGSSSGTVLWTGKLAPLSGTATIGGIHWESVIVAHGGVYATSENGNLGAGVADGAGYLSLFAPP